MVFSGGNTQFHCHKRIPAETPSNTSSTPTFYSTTEKNHVTQKKIGKYLGNNIPFLWLF